MIKKLTKVGNSNAIIIDKSIMKLLNITLETQLKFEIKGSSLIISPVKKTQLKKNSPSFQKNLDEVIKKYAPALKKLSES